MDAQSLMVEAKELLDELPVSILGEEFQVELVLEADGTQHLYGQFSDATLEIRPSLGPVWRKPEVWSVLVSRVLTELISTSMIYHAAVRSSNYPGRLVIIPRGSTVPEEALGSWFIEYQQSFPVFDDGIDGDALLFALTQVYVQSRHAEGEITRMWGSRDINQASAPPSEELLSLMLRDEIFDDSR